MFQDYKIAYMREHVKIKEVRHLSFIRQSVAYMLSLSARTIPHAAMITEFDVTPLIEYTKSAEEHMDRSKADDKRAMLLKRAVLKNYSAFFLKALAHSLFLTPTINGFLDYTPWRNGGTMYISEDINISYTVNSKFGVLKPIIRNPHQKAIETVAEEMRTLTRKARRTDANELYRRTAIAYTKTAFRQCSFNFKEVYGGWMLLRSLLFDRSIPAPEFKGVPEDQKLQVSDILGATCTLANNGMVVKGHQTVTVITPPELMMVGLGDIHPAPRIVDKQIVPGYMVTLFSTMDHRAFDGGEGFPVIGHMQRYIEHPEKIYEWKPGDEI